VNYKHGGSDTRLHTIWMDMWRRCEKPGDPAHRWYGGRGIKVCGEWQDFAAFRQWAVGAGYRDDLSIDRIDCDGDYSPENCRWATMKVQNRNRRNNARLTAFGETKTLAEWQEDSRCVVTYGAIRFRLAKGWTPEDAITKPHQVRNAKLDPEAAVSSILNHGRTYQWQSTKTR